MLRPLFIVFVAALLPGTWVFADRNSADNCSAVTTGDGNTTTIVCGDVILEAGFTKEDFLAELRIREGEIRRDEANLRELLRDNLEQKNHIQALEFQERIRVLEEQLENLKSKLSQPDDAFLAKLNTTSDRLNGLLQIKDQVSADEFGSAFAALLAGDDTRAFELFERVNKAGEPTIEIIAKSNFEQGKILEDRYDYIGAAAKYERAAQLEPENLVYARESASFASLVGKYEVAISDFSRIIEILEQDSVTLDPFEEASIYTDAAIVYFNADDLFLAEIYLNRALSLIGVNDLNNLEEEGKCLACMALIMMRFDDFDQAKQYLDRALEIAEANDDPIQISDVLAKLGSWEFHQERYSKAIERFQSAIAVMEEAGKGDHPDLAEKLHNLGFIFDKIGQPCVAAEHIDSALVIFAEARGAGHPDYQSMEANRRLIDTESCG